MKVAIAHYHLRRGGVTRVIETALDGIRSATTEVEIVVLSGESPYPGSPLEAVTRIVPGLGYRNTLEGPQDTAELAKAMTLAAADALGGPPDLWHLHNHSLGKNVAMPMVLERLLAEGAALLLQVHDFAEDGRPENYLRQRAATPPDQLSWYPSAPQIHYAVLNQRDASFLTRSGLPTGQLHLLPNAVAPPPVDAPATLDFLNPGSEFVLYPTRGIRRKNLGEMLLLAALSGDRTVFASTLAPENPEWKAIHDRWQAFASRHRLPVAMGIGDDPQVSFGGLVAAADRLLTTSVAEGFGLAFLEPWLADKPVTGRNLPEITTDFAEQGIQLEGFYDRLEVPMAWIDSNDLHRRLDESLSRAFSAYGRELPDDAIERAYMASVRDGRVDFGRLDEGLQEAVLETLLADSTRQKEIDLPTSKPGDASLINSNRRTVEDAFSIAAYGNRLSEIYESLTATSKGSVTSLDSDALLDAFLDPSRFMLLRS